MEPESYCWSLTESDPQVFNGMLRDLNFYGLQVDDLYSLDSDTLETLKPIYALIFLFKHVGYAHEAETSGVDVNAVECGLWFSSQIVNNSCGTIAALNAIMNVPLEHTDETLEKIDMGGELSNLKSFGQGLEPEESVGLPSLLGATALTYFSTETMLTTGRLGSLVIDSTIVREVHNSFNRSTPFHMDPSNFDDRPKGDAYHFITYMPFKGVLYELDGLRENPRMHATVEGDWLDQAREVIQARIATYPEGSLMFNLLALRASPVPRLENLLKDTSLPAEKRFELNNQMEQEKARLEQGKLENALRQSNILPVVFQLFRSLGENGMAGDAINAAKTKAGERKARRLAKKQADDGDDDDDDDGDDE